MKRVQFLQVGEGGAGHFVKMVHNGIEYGDMQLICEVYNILKSVLGLSNAQMHEVFAEWNKGTHLSIPPQGSAAPRYTELCVKCISTPVGELDSYLIEITRDILAKQDPDNPDVYVVDTILDAAGQKVGYCRAQKNTRCLDIKEQINVEHSVDDEKVNIHMTAGNGQVDCRGSTRIRFHGDSYR